MALTTTPDKAALRQVYDLSLNELEVLCADWGEKSYRARQIFQWLYSRKVASFDAMSNLSQDFRHRLREYLDFTPLSTANKQTSNDGTVKYLFRLPDGREIESVLIPSETLNEKGEHKRRTICVSTQVGCPLDCKFCATAALKLKRNLSVAEIIAQVLTVQRETANRITNMVFMGMGEPMLNYDNVMKAVEIITHPEAQVLSPRRITLSTAGLVNGIKRMADERRPIKLAISLHALRDELRTQLMPINKKWNLRQLGEAIDYYYRKTRRAVTYEYILFKDLNDSYQDAVRLARMARRVPSKVNVIPFHSIEFTGRDGLSRQLQPTGSDDFHRFIAQLRSLDVTVMIRSSSGKDIQAACGQLALASRRVDG